MEELVGLSGATFFSPLSAQTARALSFLGELQNLLLYLKKIGLLRSCSRQLCHLTGCYGADCSIPVPIAVWDLLTATEVVVAGAAQSAVRSYYTYETPSLPYCRTAALTSICPSGKPYALS